MGNKAPQTASPAVLAAIAARNGTEASTAATQSTGIITGVSRGMDPVSGKPITSIVYPAGSEQSLIKLLPPAERAKLQQKMLKLKLYPQGYTPGEILSTEDFNAVQKLIIVGEQKGISDINDVISLASKDKTVKTYLQSGGYAAQGNVISTTTATEAASTLNDTFLNLFNEKPSKAEIADYTTALNSRERKAKGAISVQEQNDIILAVANKKITGLSGKALTGDKAALEALDTGQLGKRVREIRSAYKENGIPVSEKTVFRLAGSSLRSAQAYDNINEDITQAATLQWGKLGENLKPGQTMRGKLQPYITLKANVRGIPEDQINTSEMLDVLNPDGTFKRPDEYELNQMKTPDYLNSNDYKNTVRNDTQAVLRNFGIG